MCGNCDLLKFLNEKYWNTYWKVKKANVNPGRADVADYNRCEFYEQYADKKAFHRLKR